MSSASTAILIFGRQAAAEAQHKLAQRGRATGSTRLCHWLLRHTRRTAQATGLPVVWVDSTVQQGPSFGARLCHALEAVWQQGYERVLLLGTDTPGLSVDLLHQAQQQLQQGQAVLGAAQDGGIYLLGLQRGGYCPQQLAALPWEQAHLFEALQSYLCQTGSAPEILRPVLADVDHWSDVHQWIQSTRPSRLRLYLEQCAAFPHHTPPAFVPTLGPVEAGLVLPCNRPPPATWAA